MKKHYLPKILCALTLFTSMISGCRPIPVGYDQTDTPEVRPSPTSIDEMVTSLPSIPVGTSTSKPEVTARPSRTPDSKEVDYVSHCLEIEQTVPDHFIADGGLFISQTFRTVKDKTLLFRSQDNQLVEYSDLPFTFYDFSPNGKYIANESETTDDNGNEKYSILIRGPGKNDVREIPSEERPFIMDWMDGNTLGMILRPGNEWMRFINLETGDTHDFRFPKDLYPILETDYARLNSQFSHLIFYYEEFYWVLWEVNNRQEIWRMLAPNTFTSADPSWAHDGKKFAIILSDQKPIPNDQIYQVDLSGVAKPLTEMHKYHEITDPIWSPDDQSIAFWMDESLAVLDVSSGVVTTYCIPSFGSESRVPVWSPDSQQIAMDIAGDDDETNRVQVVVVDIDKERAVLIAENSIVQGWISSEWDNSASN